MITRRKQSGQAMVEAALMAPWIFFLFIGVFDFGFYAYAAMCTQNAARAVALTASESATAGVAPCVAAVGEMAWLPNVQNAPSPCTKSSSPPSSLVPVTVSLASGNPGTATCPDSAPCVQATVRYQTVSLIPIPGVLQGSFILNRQASAKVITP